MIIAQLTKRDGSFLLGREADDSFDFSKLKGKSIIAGRPGGMPYMTLLYVLRQHGLEPGSDVEVISNIQFNLMGGAFESGTGDYVTLFEPTASAFAAQGKGHIVTNMGLESGEVPYTTFMMRKDTIENEPGFAAASSEPYTGRRSGYGRQATRRSPTQCSLTSRIPISPRCLP